MPRRYVRGGAVRRTGPSIAWPSMSVVTPQADLEHRPNPWVRLLLLVVVLVFAAFWIWALFFASKESVNRIDDRAWAERAESICLTATEERNALADLLRVEEPTPELVSRRADIVDTSTDVLERMLDDVVAVEPSDAKGQGIVPLWEEEYRVYLQDRRNYADRLRASGEYEPFTETPVDGIPISERLATFAADNEMSTCAPPIDLTR
jgi:hypothetical protein